MPITKKLAGREMEREQGTVARVLTRVRGMEIASQQRAVPAMTRHIRESVAMATRTLE